MRPFMQTTLNKNNRKYKHTSNKNGQSALFIQSRLFHIADPQGNDMH